MIWKSFSVFWKFSAPWSKNLNSLPTDITLTVMILLWKSSRVSLNQNLYSNFVKLSLQLFRLRAKTMTLSITQHKSLKFSLLFSIWTYKFQPKSVNKIKTWQSKRNQTELLLLVKLTKDKMAKVWNQNIWLKIQVSRL